MKTRFLRTLLLVSFISGLLFLSAPVRSVQAAVGCSWNGIVNANWSNAGNWGSGCSGTAGIPGSGDALTFPTGASHTSMNDDLPAIALQSLTFTSSLAYTLNGANTISLSGGVDVQGGNQTINAPLAVLNNSVVFKAASGSKLFLGGTLNVGSHTLTATVNTAAGVTGMEMLNTLTGGTPSSLGKLAKDGTGDLKIIGDDRNAYLDIDLNAGSISTDPANPTQLPWFATISLASGTNLNLLAYDGIGNLAGSGNLHASSSLMIRQYKNTTFTGDLFGNGQMNIIGTGILTINRSGGSLSYTGEIYVNVGPSHVRLINTTATSVTDFRINGNGTNSILELTGSHVSVVRLSYPGDSKLHTATLLLSGTAASSANQVIVEATGCGIASAISSASNYGHLNVTAPLDLGGQGVTFSLSGSYAPKLGDVFNIIHNTVSGAATLGNATFSGLPQGGTLTFNSVALTANYQADGNTTFALSNSMRLYLPLIKR